MHLRVVIVKNSLQLIAHHSNSKLESAVQLALAVYHVINLHANLHLHASRAVLRKTVVAIEVVSALLVRSSYSGVDGDASESAAAHAPLPAPQHLTTEFVLFATVVKSIDAVKADSVFGCLASLQPVLEGRDARLAPE